MFGFGRKVAKKAPARTENRAIGIGADGEEFRFPTAAEQEARDRAALPAEWQDCYINWKGVYVWDVVTVDGRHARVMFYDGGGRPTVREYVGTFEH